MKGEKIWSMSNICDTQYKVRGSRKALSDLWNTLQMMEVNSKDTEVSDLARTGWIRNFSNITNIIELSRRHFQVIKNVYQEGIASNTMVEKLTSVSKNWDLHLLSNSIKGGSINISTSAAKSFEKGHASYRTSFEGHTYYVRKTHVPRSKDDDLHGFLRKIIRSFSLTTMGLQRICQHTEILLKFRS